jgi:hypothetical protein
VVPPAVELEMLLHGDIKIVNATDTYENMIHKVFDIFEFGVKACGSTYVLRSNDDVYLRLGVVLKQVSRERRAGGGGGGLVLTRRRC